jgi:hypothetical protein
MEEFSKIEFMLNYPNLLALKDKKKDVDCIVVLPIDFYVEPPQFFPYIIMILGAACLHFDNLYSVSFDGYVTTFKREAVAKFIMDYVKTSKTLTILSLANCNIDNKWLSIYVKRGLLENTSLRILNLGYNQIRFAEDRMVSCFEFLEALCLNITLEALYLNNNEGDYHWVEHSFVEDFKEMLTKNTSLIYFSLSFETSFGVMNMGAINYQYLFTPLLAANVKKYAEDEWIFHREDKEMRDVVIALFICNKAFAVPLPIAIFNYVFSFWTRANYSCYPALRTERTCVLDKFIFDKSQAYFL